MAKHGNYDEDLLWEFIESVGLTKDCDEFCKKKEKEALEKAKDEPIGDRCFHWEGHYSKCCYEMSGENFYDSGAFNWKCSERYIPVEYFDPSSSEKEFSNIPEGTDVVSLREMEDLCNVTFDEVLERLINFCNGDIGEGDSCYMFDDFGFDVMPTKKQFTEWLEQLRFVKDKIDSNLDASDFFEESGF